MAVNKIFEKGTASGGIEVLERGAAEERAAQYGTVPEPQVVAEDADRWAEIESTRAHLTRALKVAKGRYTKASSLMKNELYIPMQAIESTLERVISAFYREKE